MKRMHIHVGVENLDQSIRFYSALFGEEPAKTKPDYAKWMLDDPRINFAISTRAGTEGVDHLGIQVEEDSELNLLRERLKTAEMSVFDEGETVCCYAQSDKSWIRDPTGIAWEVYKTMADAQLFYKSDPELTGQCCTPDTVDQSGGCCRQPSDSASGCCG